ncbi:MAG: polysaccharide biosynthesis protein [Alphaproteobacteria bacterium]|nr:polysaccharide biosynthesis protein [Alphaproteobacteria bacterium]
MTSFYFKKFKQLSVSFLYSMVHYRFAFLFTLDIFIVMLSFLVSLLLQGEEDFQQISTSALLLNVGLYTLCGISIFGVKYIYQERWPFLSLRNLLLNSLYATCITLLYIPLTYILPESLALPQATVFISWFVLIVFLEIPHQFYLLFSHYQNKELKGEAVTLSSAPKQVLKPLFIEDLLVKPEVNFEPEAIGAMITGKRVLVIGVEGIFGEELAYQIADFDPSHMCFVENSEDVLYSLDLKMAERYPQLARENKLGNAACREGIRHIISTFKPDLIFHTASLKHSLFAEGNPSQTVLTNVMGTRNVADACRDFKVKSMIFVSTHDALHPTHILGATKRLGECYCQALDSLEQKKPNGTRYTIVRLGRILGASDSMVPLFIWQIGKGGPLTVTHPDLMYHVLTTREAVQLTLQAMTFSTRSKTQAGRLFVVSMGDPIKILELAQQMITLAGLKVDEDIKIKFTGLKPGEKLIEDISFERLSPTKNPRIFVDTSRTMDHGFLTRALHELETAAKNQDEESIFRLLHALIPEYKKSTLPENGDLDESEE